MQTVDKISWGNGSTMGGYIAIWIRYVKRKETAFDIRNLNELLFLAVLKLQPKDSLSYEKEIEILSGQK